jgi:hypothetical protein
MRDCSRSLGTLVITLVMTTACGQGKATFISSDAAFDGLETLDENVHPAMVYDSDSDALVLAVFRSGNFRSATADEPAIRVFRANGRGKGWVLVGRIMTPVCYGTWGYDLTLDGGTLYFVWTASRDGRKQILFSSSSDSGRTWGHYLPVNDSDVGQRRQPVVAVWNSTLFVAWQDEREGGVGTWFTQSTDGGLTWAPNAQLDRLSYERVLDSKSPRWITGDAQHGCVIPSGWSDKKPLGTLLVSVTEDVGTSWEARVSLPDILVSDAAVVATGQVLNAIVVGNMGIKSLPTTIGGTPELRGHVYFMMSKDGGKTWRKRRRIDDDPGDSSKWAPMLLADGRRLVAIWEDDRSVEGLYVTFSGDAGRTWTENERIADPSHVGHTDYSAVLVNNRLFVAAHDMHRNAGDCVTLTGGELPQL